MLIKRVIAVVLAVLQIGFSVSFGARRAVAQVVIQVRGQSSGSNIRITLGSNSGVTRIGYGIGVSLAPLSPNSLISTIPGFKSPSVRLSPDILTPIPSALTHQSIQTLSEKPLSVPVSQVESAAKAKASVAEAVSPMVSTVKSEVSNVGKVISAIGKALKLTGLRKRVAAEETKSAAEKDFAALRGERLISGSKSDLAPKDVSKAPGSGARLAKSVAGTEIKPTPSIEKASLESEAPAGPTRFWSRPAFRWVAGLAGTAGLVALVATAASPVVVIGTLGSVALSVISIPQIIRNFRQGREATKDLASASTLIWFAAATLLSIVSVGQGNSLPWIAANVAGVLGSVIVLGQIAGFNKDKKVVKIGLGIAAAAAGLIALVATQAFLPLATWLNITFWGAMALLWVLNWPQIQRNYNIFKAEGRAPLGIQPMYPALVAGGSLLHLFAAFAASDYLWAMNAVIAIITSGAVLLQIYAPRATNAVIGPMVKVAEKLGIGTKAARAPPVAPQAELLAEARGVVSELFKDAGYVGMAGVDHDSQLSRMSDLAAELPGRSMIILEAPTAAGKSTLAARLEEVLGMKGEKIKSLEVDRYFKNKSEVPRTREGHPDFDRPDSLHLDRVAHDLKALLEGKRIELPYYDMETGKFLPHSGEFFELGPDQVLVIDSIYASHKKILDAGAGYKSLNVFLFAPAAIRLARRLLRDKNERAIPVADNLARWATILADEKEFILPLEGEADIVMNLVGARELEKLPEVFAGILAQEWASNGKDPEFTDLFIRRLKASIEADKSYSQRSPERANKRRKQVVDLLGRLQTAGILNPSLKGFPEDRVKKLRSFFSPSNIRISSVKGEGLRKIIVDEVAKKGKFRFKNAWEAGNTAGGTSSRVRNMIESFRLGISRESHARMKDREKPFYAYFQFKKALGKGQTGRLHLQRYGDDIWIFKTKTVMGNMTATVGDSYTHKAEREYLLAEYLNNSWSEFAVSDDQVSNPMVDPHEVFLPYLEYRDVFARYYLKEWDRHGYREKPLLDRRNVAEPAYVWKDEWSTDVPALSRYNYFEAQIFESDLTLDHISEFIFTKTPPQEEFIKVLQAKGIKIYDGRDKRRRPVPYQ